LIRDEEIAAYTGVYNVGKYGATIEGGQYQCCSMQHALMMGYESGESDIVMVPWLASLRSRYSTTQHNMATTADFRLT
jgi:hypothetical protein